MSNVDRTKCDFCGHVAPGKEPFGWSHGTLSVHPGGVGIKTIEFDLCTTCFAVEATNAKATWNMGSLLQNALKLIGVRKKDAGDKGSQ